MKKQFILVSAMCVAAVSANAFNISAADSTIAYNAAMTAAQAGLNAEKKAAPAVIQPILDKILPAILVLIGGGFGWLIHHFGHKQAATIAATPAAK